MSKKDRESCGQGNELPEEIAVKVESKAEKELQREIRQYLGLLEIEFICPPMNKRSTLPTGWPDITLAYKGLPICFECKVGNKQPDTDQAYMHEKLRMNGWHVFVIRELREVQEVFRRIDGEIL